MSAGEAETEAEVIGPANAFFRPVVRRWRPKGSNGCIGDSPLSKRLKIARFIDEKIEIDKDEVK